MIETFQRRLTWFKRILITQYRQPLIAELYLAMGVIARRAFEPKHADVEFR